MPVWLTKFLKRQTNSAKVIIKGKRVNRGSGYGLKISCEYHFHRDRFSCQWLKEKLNNTSVDTFSDYGSSSNEINKILIKDFDMLPNNDLNTIYIA